MAIIDNGEIVLEAEPLRAIEELRGRIWRRMVPKDELPAVERGMAGGGYAFAFRTAHDVGKVTVPIVTLLRVVRGGVAVDAAWMRQHGIDVVPGGETASRRLSGATVRLAVCPAECGDAASQTAKPARTKIVTGSLATDVDLPTRRSTSV